MAHEASCLFDVADESHTTLCEFPDGSIDVVGAQQHRHWCSFLGVVRKPATARHYGESKPARTKSKHLRMLFQQRQPKLVDVEFAGLADIGNSEHDVSAFEHD